MTPDLENDLDGDMQRIAAHYDALLAAHGDTPAAVQQRDRLTQETRMRVLCGIGDLTRASILDFGCGTGHLLHLLRQQFGYVGQYTGLDISEAHVRAAAGKFPDARFEVRNILRNGIDGTFDYVFVNGVFNNLITDNWAFMTQALSILFEHATRGVSFNALSTYVDYQDRALYYADPRQVFDFCKRSLSRRVTLRHDYHLKAGVIPYEFTIYVYRE